MIFFGPEYKRSATAGLQHRRGGFWQFGQQLFRIVAAREYTKNLFLMRS
jgi:hypothetical protein